MIYPIDHSLHLDTVFERPFNQILHISSTSFLSIEFDHFVYLYTRMKYDVHGGSLHCFKYWVRTVDTFGRIFNISQNQLH